ncbi:MAG TPA: YceI family protein [Chitinophagaceae bacterium]|nr:YceI family protein [Chitinophagaceae bacterium]
MKWWIFSCFLTINTVVVSAQDRLITKNGTISFYSKTPLEDIEAHTRTSISVLDKKTGQIEFIALIKSFTFEKALMQEHFNENYMESDKFPKSAFKGRIVDLTKVDFNKDGKYMVTVAGDLTLHGITKTITTPAIITVQNRNISASADFNVQLADYKISIPALVRDKISKTVKIAVNLKYD